MINQNKMGNGEQGAFAMLDTNGSFTQYGLTKREYFAAMAMQGLVDRHISYEVVAEHAVKYGDALLKELDKPKSE